MKPIREYECDNPLAPTHDEIKRCVQMANIEDSIIKLDFYVKGKGWETLVVKQGMTIETCKNQLQRYGLFIDDGWVGG